MACPRCGCRMRSKVIAAGAVQLVCCDCGVNLKSSLSSGPRRPPITLGAVALLSLFGFTAMAQMAVKDHQRTPQLRDRPAFQLGTRGAGDPRSRSWILVPLPPATGP